MSSGSLLCGGDLVNFLEGHPTAEITLSIHALNPPGSVAGLSRDDLCDWMM